MIFKSTQRIRLSTKEQQLDFFREKRKPERLEYGAEKKLSQSRIIFSGKTSFNK